MIAEALAAKDEPPPIPVEPPPRVAPLPDPKWQQPEQMGLFDRPAAGPQLSKTSQDTAPRFRLIKGGLS
jgi:hypothetical protein